MKSKIASVPLLLAGFILLLSLLVPHHHHSELICFELSHCNTTEKAGCGCGDTHSTPEEDEDGCLVSILNRMEFVRQQQFAPDFEIHEVCGHSNMLFLLLSDGRCLSDSQAPFRPFVSGPVSLWGYDPEGGIGRRGPPCVLS